MALPDSNYKNLAAAVIPNPGATTDTSITISATDGATFPNAPFFATIMPIDKIANSTNSEIVEVTAVNTSGANTTFTVTRAQRDTSAISWNANGAVITHAVYTEDVTPLQDAAFIGQELSTPTDVAYVATENIQDGAVTPDKIATSTYSTNEQVVGEWIDGNPLYRKVISGTYVPTTTRRVTILTVDNTIETLVSVSGSVTLNSGATQSFVPGQSLYDASKNLLVSSTVAYNGESINLVTINVNTSSTSQYPYNIVVEYTKTTD